MLFKKEKVSEALITYREAKNTYKLEMKRLKRAAKKNRLERRQLRAIKRIAKRTYQINKPLA